MKGNRRWVIRKWDIVYESGGERVNERGTRECYRKKGIVRGWVSVS